MKVVNNVTVSVGEPSRTWLPGLGRIDLEPQIIGSENIPPHAQTAINRLDTSMEELFSSDVSGTITLRSDPDKGEFMLEGKLHIYERYSENVVRRSLGNVYDSASRLAEKMPFGRQFVYTVCCSAEQFQKAA